MPRKRRLMIDLETTDTEVTAAVWQVGYAQLGGTFKGCFLLNPYQQMGRTISDKTVVWLAENAPDWTPSQAIFPLLDPASTILHDFCEAVKNMNFDEIWCKGADFDFAIFRSLLSQYGIPLPWRYNRQCCMRASLNTYPEFEIDFGDGSKGHNALFDSEIQNDCLEKILKFQGRY